MNIREFMGISENTVVKSYKVFMQDGIASGKKYLSVDKKGIATAKSQTGIVKVVAYDKDQKELGSCYVDVVKPALTAAKQLPVLTNPTATLDMKGYIANLPTNGSELSWSLASDKIAAIDKTGVLTLKGTGSGKVTVIASFKYTYKDAKGAEKEAYTKIKTTVTVKLPKQSVAETKTVTVKTGKTVTLKMTNLSDQKKVEWTVADTSKLTKGEQKDTAKASSLKLTGTKAGTTKVIATVDGIAYTFNVTVQ